MKNTLWLALAALAFFAGCERKTQTPDPSKMADQQMPANDDGAAEISPSESNLVGTIKIDGSSTVQPISDAVREGFIKMHPNVNIIVSGNGTGNGFKSFYDKGTDISDASRPIKPGEFEKCKENGVEFVELPVAY